ncbi:MAG: LysR family transcriptional regulator [Cyclobacteriaceae bacterium]
MKDIRIGFRMKVFVGDEAYLGKGPIELLKAIDQKGSIAKAAETTKLSYRKAWQLVENMNRIATQPLVEKKLGGNRGGGASVTLAGKTILRQYQSLEEEVDEFIQNKFKGTDFV